MTAAAKRVLILGSTGPIGTQAPDVIRAGDPLPVPGLAEATDSRLIPVASEHSALYQLTRPEPPGTVTRLVLTASGGPFRGQTDLSGVTRDEALSHPTW